MSTLYELQLIPGPQQFQINLGGTVYTLSLAWCPPASCWVLDIAAVDGVSLVSGIAVVTGVDLLGQYKHLGFQGELRARTEGDPDAIPPYANLGTVGKLYWVSA